MSLDPAKLLRYPDLQRPDLMPNDLLAPELTWGDLEATWMKLAAPANIVLVRDLVTALWKESSFLPETHTFHRILAATVVLAGPAYELGLEEVPATPT